MSFILDALRKSEHERRRQAGPGVAELPAARSASRLPVALFAVAALLAVNLLVLLYWLLAREPSGVAREDSLTTPAAQAVTQAPAQAAPQAPAQAAAAAPPAGEVVRPAPVRPREVRPLSAETATLPPPDDAPPAAPDPSLLPAFPPPEPSPAAQPRRQVTDPPVPRLDSLPPQATAGLPVLNLDLHIYSGDPTQRAVFINGHRYQAGDTLPEGVEVVAITPEGVVLRHRGQRFLLPAR